MTGAADPTAPWRQAGRLESGDLVREVFMFRSAGVLLSASLYAHRSCPLGRAIVICDPWGFEANHARALRFALARRTAAAGGAALVFDYPGHGDSEGDATKLTMPQAVAAAVQAVAEGARRVDASWLLCGLRVGASVSALASRDLAVTHQILVDPVLEPEAYFSALLRRASRAGLGRPVDDELVFGMPFPEWARGAGSEQTTNVAAALAEFRGRGAVIGYSPSPVASDQFEHVVVNGKWRDLPSSHPRLQDGVMRWVTRTFATG